MSKQEALAEVREPDKQGRRSLGAGRYEAEPRNESSEAQAKPGIGCGTLLALPDLRDET